MLGLMRMLSFANSDHFKIPRKKKVRNVPHWLSVLLESYTFYLLYVFALHHDDLIFKSALLLYYSALAGCIISLLCVIQS